MLIILSPAKTMDMTQRAVEIPVSRPLFEEDAEKLAKMMQRYTVEELEKLLKISRTLAEENYQRYQQFDSALTPVRPALLAYNGSVFKNIGIDTFTKADFLYAQTHLRIISTMYGLVRPLDGIKAYRMAYLMKLQGLEYKNLYDYWLPKLTQPLLKEIRQDGGVLVNLGSLDVWGGIGYFTLTGN